MKKLVLPIALSICVASNIFANNDFSKELEEMKKQIAELKAAQEKINIDALKRQLQEVKAHDAGDNIKWDIDFRTSYDIVDYKINGASDTDNSLWSNKLILGMAAQPLDNLVFKGALGVYKSFGNNNSQAMNPYQNMDWYATQTPSGDATIRLREAYFLYFGEMGEIPYTASFGRRPSTDGFLVNYRADNAKPASPIGHNINMEFDGASFMFDFENITDISGLYFKLCLGRGNSDTEAKYPGFTSYGAYFGVQPSATQNPYITGDFDSPNMDLAGILMQLYNDGQYKVMANYFLGWNMMGASFAPTGQNHPVNGNPLYGVSMTDVGDMSGGALSIEVNGLSDENDFLMDTLVFASFAWSKTDPNGNNVGTFNPTTGAYITAPAGMLGSTKSQTGTSYYLGIQIPGFMESDRIGFEYNHGSKYWRSFTYGEDTLVGSKLATRGDAYEMYYNFPILGKNLTGQLRYTYIDYDYTGSDMFFGQTGAPMDVDTTPGAVKEAQDIRFSIRYRY